MGKNMEVAGAPYSTFSIAKYKVNKYNISKVSSSYFYTIREVYWPTSTKGTKYFVVS